MCSKNEKEMCFKASKRACNKAFFFAAIGLVMIAMHGCGEEASGPSAPLSSEFRDVQGEFEGIVAEGADVNVIVRHASSAEAKKQWPSGQNLNHIKVIADERDIGKVYTRVESAFGLPILRVGVQNDNGMFSSSKVHAPIQVYVLWQGSAKGCYLRLWHASGSSTIDVDAVASHKLALNASGSSKIKVDKLIRNANTRSVVMNAKESSSIVVVSGALGKFFAEAFGSSQIDCSGITGGKLLNATADGGSKIHLGRIQTSVGSIWASGSAEIKVDKLDTLNLISNDNVQMTAKGSSSIVAASGSLGQLSAEASGSSLIDCSGITGGKLLKASACGSSKIHLGRIQTPAGSISTSGAAKVEGPSLKVLP